VRYNALFGMGAPTRAAQVLSLGEGW
jgi:hypothetical protein